MEPSFSNTPNRLAKESDVGKTWISRSCAVVNLIVGLQKGVPHVLMVKRGPGAPDNVGKWVLPCGYLDNDETLADAARREAWEESGVDVRDIVGYTSSSYCSGQPVFVNSAVDDKTSPRQNVSHYFSLTFFAISGFPSTSTENCEPDEIEEVAWVSADDLMSLVVGFNHKERIYKLSPQFLYYDRNSRG